MKHDYDLLQQSLMSGFYWLEDAKTEANQVIGMLKSDLDVDNERVKIIKDIGGVLLYLSMASKALGVTPDQCLDLYKASVGLLKRTKEPKPLEEKDGM